MSGLAGQEEAPRLFAITSILRLDTGQVLQALVTVAALITLLVVLFHR